MAGASPPGTATVHLQVAFWTQWGQQVALLGAGPTLGAWKVLARHVLQCHHGAGGELVWQLTLSVPLDAVLVYKYAVVGEGLRVEKEEDGLRKVAMPSGLEPGDHLDVLDRWRVRISIPRAPRPPHCSQLALSTVLRALQIPMCVIDNKVQGATSQDTSHPAYLMSRSAFTDVILPGKTRVEQGVIQRLDRQSGEVILRFRAWCEECRAQNAALAWLLTSVHKFGQPLSISSLCVRTWILANW